MSTASQPALLTFLAFIIFYWFCWFYSLYWFYWFYWLYWLYLILLILLASLDFVDSIASIDFIDLAQLLIIKNIPFIMQCSLNSFHFMLYRNFVKQNINVFFYVRVFNNIFIDVFCFFDLFTIWNNQRIHLWFQFNKFTNHFPFDFIFHFTNHFFMTE